MFKQEINLKLKEKIEKRFYDFCDNYKTELKEPFVSYSCCEKIVENLKSDYENFYSDNNYKLRFRYPYERFANKNKLKENQYKKLIEEFSEEEQIYFVINLKMKEIFENLDTKIDCSDFNSKLTAKRLFNYNYFIDSLPRCCFCGQILEESKNENNENFVNADIEHIIPKVQYPQFALHPNNWAPCCKECNMGEKGTKFFNGNNPQEQIEGFKYAIKNLNLDITNFHPLKLWKNLKISYDNNGSVEPVINSNLSNEAKELLSFYGIEKRAKIIFNRCYDILFNIIRHSDIRSPESLERLLENMASSNWHEINDGYSLNNSPQIWQEFVENILYDECKLMALWDEVKSSYYLI